MKFASCLILALALVLAAFTTRAQTNLPSASTNTPPPAAKSKARSKPYSGSVISVDRDAKTFTITLEKGKMKILHITEKTKFKKGGALAAFADLDLGEAVKGYAHEDDSGILIASTVNILLPKAAPDDTAH
jgi:hypothetical protein